MKKETKGLVSVIILSYNNYRYIYEALDSFLSQDYSRLELIINNDGSSDFDESAIKKYLQIKRSKNLEKFLIINNKRNLGTVKSLNNAIRKSTGEFVIFFAADDAFNDSKVITKFITAFNKLPVTANIVTAQLAMYDLDLYKRFGLFIKNKDIQVLKKKDPEELFSVLCTRCIIAAASTCYRKSLFKKHGYFDERYKLIEDWSSALRFSRLGEVYHFENFIAFKHRDGGISHGNIHGEKKLNQKYDNDVVQIMKYEILPYISRLDDKRKKSFLTKYKDLTWLYNYNFKFRMNLNKRDRRHFVVKNWHFIIRFLCLDLKDYVLQQPEGKKLKVLLFSVLILTLPMPDKIFDEFAMLLIFSLSVIVIYQIFIIFSRHISKLVDFIL